ncbi:hypothetical protein CEQ21_07235 (plasmid) [Niallia circulans]|uniref:ImmA/IrrE family metallo-endopeptidase n=1 Tax=Niallia circulans TaxID=1397 RepID=A0A553SQT9_NIACI|nr:ArdC family protein [Niallia circulans]TRZ39347.1 hypothetical protein CEQ21_07235 [Niallia circulans]
MANPKYNRKTSEERKQEIQAISEKALQQIEKYTKSVDDVLEYANFMSRFHSYSANNLALIQQQFEGAEAVSSFKDWKDKGYSVQKGEKGIQILSYAPVTLFKDAKGEMKQLSQATPQEKKLIKDGQIPTRKIANFKVGHVFDISQTNAPIEDLPKIFPNKQFNFQIEEGRNAEHLRKGIEAVSKELNIDIRDMRQSELGVTELGASKGAFVQGKDGKEIVMNSRNTETQALATSIHELAHAKLHIKGGEYDNMERATKEFQAELTSYIVCKHFGMDTSEKAIPYIATWTQNGEKIEDKQKALEGVHKTAKEFIEIMDTFISEEKEKEMQVANEQEVKPEFNDRQLHYMSNILIADEASLRKNINIDPWSDNFYENLSNGTVERTQAVEKHLNQDEINQVMQEVNVYRNEIDAKEEFTSTNLYDLVRGKDILKFKELKEQIKDWQEDSKDINPIPGIEEQIFRDKLEYDRIDTTYDKDDNDRKALTKLQTRIELNSIKVQESELTTATNGEYSMIADQEIKQEEVKMYPIDPDEAIYCELTGKAIPDNDIYYRTNDGKSLSEEAKMLMYTNDEWTKSTENGNYQTFNFYSVHLSNSDMTSKKPEPRIDNKNEYYFYDGQSKPVKLGTVSDIVSSAQNQESIDHFSLDKEFIRDLAFSKNEPKEEFNEKMQKHNVLKSPKLKDFQQANERLGLEKNQNLIDIKKEAGIRAQMAALKMGMQR